MANIQDWIRFWLRRDEREFEESVARQRELEQESNLPSDVLALLHEHIRDRHQRDRFPVGAFFDSIAADRHGGTKPTMEKLMAVAEVGKDLLYTAICTADDDDNAEFFVEAYSCWGPLVDAVLAECDLGVRDGNGHRVQF